MIHFRFYQNIKLSVSDVTLIFSTVLSLGTIGLIDVYTVFNISIKKIIGRRQIRRTWWPWKDSEFREIIQDPDVCLRRYAYIVTSLRWKTNPRVCSAFLGAKNLDHETIALTSDYHCIAIFIKKNMIFLRLHHTKLCIWKATTWVHD